MELFSEFWRALYTFFFATNEWLLTVLKTAPMWQKFLAIFLSTALISPMLALPTGFAVSAGFVSFWPAVIIHAVAMCVKEAAASVLLYFGVRCPESKFGGLVLRKQYLRNIIAGCLKAMRHKWVRWIFGGCYFWKLLTVKVLPFIPYSGLGFITYGVLTRKRLAKIALMVVFGQVLSSPLLIGVGTNAVFRQLFLQLSYAAALFVPIIIAWFMFRWLRDRGLLAHTWLPA